MRNSGLCSATSGAIEIVYCEEAKNLLEALGRCIHEVTLLHGQQFSAVVREDSDIDRIDDLIRLATHRKNQAKYAYMEHLSTHRCSK